MKELSIEEKAKRYDEAIKLAKDSYNYPSYPGFIRADVVFPELKESEDERIRKALIEGFNKLDKSAIWYNGITNGQILSWLEKQGEQKKSTKEKLMALSDGKQHLGWLDDADKVIESEQKPADNVEPKFKVGDIVKHKDNPHLTYILKRFTDDGDYEFHAIGKDGNEGCIRFTGVKYQDEWELVEQKPTVEMKTPEESLGIDSDTYNKIVDECIYGEQKPAWSEEDEEILYSIINDIEIRSGRITLAELKESYTKQIDWLKSLKERYTWKPSDKQMKALTFACIKNTGIDKSSIKALYELKEQLKQL